MVFFIYLHHGKEHQIFGIRAIIEAIQAGSTVDKVYIQKKQVVNL
jgi:23S rRNA (guanosine2251-2'-O)-methyltransferase